MQVPAKHRDGLVSLCQGQMTVTRHPQGSLLLFPRPVWEVERAVIAGWDNDAAAWKRVLLGDAEDIEIDGNGRILVPADLRSEVGIERDREVKFIGLGAYFEIWDLARLKAVELTAAALPMPAVVKNHAFGKS